MANNSKLFILSAIIAPIFLASLMIHAMEESPSVPEQKIPTKNTVDHHNIKALMENHLKKNLNLLNSSKDKDIVIFLGDTGAGKSTLINYLSEKKLIVDDDTNDIILDNPNDLSAMAIGVGHNSETFLPRFIESDGLLFYDLPGFGDTRGSVINLVNACFIKHIIENAKSVKLVFVAEIGQITTDRGANFNEFLNKVRKLISGNKLESFSSLIITKSYVEIGKLASTLSKKIGQTSILEPWVSNGSLGQMSNPVGHKIDHGERDIILNIINKTKSQKIENINIDVIYDEDDQDRIKRIYDEEIWGIADRLINNNISSETFFSLNLATLKKQKKYMQNSFLKDINVLLGESDVIRLLCPISGNIFHLSWQAMEKLFQSEQIVLINQIKLAIKDKQAAEALIQKENAERERDSVNIELSRMNTLLTDTEKEKNKLLSEIVLIEQMNQENCRKLKEAKRRCKFQENEIERQKRDLKEREQKAQKKEEEQLFMVTKERLLKANYQLNKEALEAMSEEQIRNFNDELMTYLTKEKTELKDALVKCGLVTLCSAGIAMLGTIPASIILAIVYWIKEHNLNSTAEVCREILLQISDEYYTDSSDSEFSPFVEMIYHTIELKK